MAVIEQHGGRVGFDTPITGISLDKKSRYELFSGERKVATAKKVIMATGAVEKPNPHLESVAKDRLVLSSQLLKGDFSQIKDLKGEDPAELVLVGSSHAAAAVLQVLKKYDIDRPVTVIGRRVNLFEEEEAPNHPFDGIRLSRDRFRRMLAGTSRDQFVQVGDFRDATELIQRAERVIQCLGLTPVVPNEQGTQRPFFDLEGGHPVVTASLAPGALTLHREGERLSNAWGLGVGYTPRATTGGREVGVDIFRFHAFQILEQLWQFYRQSRSHLL